MKHVLVPLLLLVVIFVPLAPSAPINDEPGSHDGNTLLTQCKAAVDWMDNPSRQDTLLDAFGTGVCMGLVEGISFASPKVCPTKGVVIAQETRVVLKYLIDHPEKLNLDQRILVDNALSKAFPCPKQ